MHRLPPKAAANLWHASRHAELRPSGSSLAVLLGQPLVVLLRERLVAGAEAVLGSLHEHVAHPLRQRSPRRPRRLELGLEGPLLERRAQMLGLAVALVGLEFLGLAGFLA